MVKRVLIYNMFCVICWLYICERLMKFSNNWYQFKIIHKNTARCRSKITFASNQLLIYFLNNKLYPIEQVCSNLTMHHFVTEMCAHVHIYITKWCIVVYLSGALWDFWEGSIGTTAVSKCSLFSKLEPTIHSTTICNLVGLIPALHQSDWRIPN